MDSIGTANRLGIFTYSELNTEYIKSEAESPYFVTSLTESLRQEPKTWANENVMVKPLIDSQPNSDMNVLKGETHLLIFRHLEKILPRFQEDI